MNPSDTCILAIDFQENYRPGVNPEKTLTVPEWNQILQNANRLLAVARAVRTPIVHVTHLPGFCSGIVPYAAGWGKGMDLIVRRSNPIEEVLPLPHESEKKQQAKDVVGQWFHCTCLIPDRELSRDPADYLVMKSGRNAFRDTGLIDFLAERSVMHVCCMGFEAKDCVMFAAYTGAVRHKLHMTIVQDCTNGAEPTDMLEVERGVHKTLAELGIEFRTADEVARSLQGKIRA